MRLHTVIRQRCLHDDERGSTTIFAIGLLVMVLIVVVLVSTAAAVHLERKRLWNYADSLALDASDALTYEAHLDSSVTDAEVVEQVTKFVNSPRPGDPSFTNTTIGTRTGYRDSGQVVVHLHATHKPGSLPWMLAPWSNGIAIEAESVANITVPD